MKEIGLQLFTLRKYLGADDIAKTLKRVKEAGYSGVQLCGTLDEMRTAGFTAKKAGLKVLGSTASFDIYKQYPDEIVKLMSELGADDIGIGWYPMRDLDDMECFIGEANRLGRYFAEHGMHLSYHNHAHEFIKPDGIKTFYDHLIEKLDPELVKFVADTYWMQYGGADVRETLGRLEGRVSILHLKDMKSTRKGPTFAEIGNGNLCWDKIIPLAEKIGVKEFVVEQDECDGDPFDSIKQSSDYLYKKFINEGGKNE